MLRRIALLSFVACAADHQREHTAPVATVSASASAATTALVDAGRKDWMWELVGGAREVFWRWPHGACEKWRVEPEGAPADYRGTIFRDEGAIELQMTYEGTFSDAPRVRAPRVVEDRANDAGANRFELACIADDHGAWYLDEASCAAGGAPPLAPVGCLSAIAPDTRAKAAGALHGEIRSALADAVSHARFVWMSMGCEKRVVRKRNQKLWLNGSYLYPTLVRWTMHGVILEEQAEANPDYVAPPVGGEGIALGCCDIQTFVVTSFENGVADMRRIGRTTTPERWYVDKAPPADVIAACMR
jgi:hypothetical protein